VRCFLDKHGAKTFRAQGKPGEGHVDIASEILAQQGINPVDLVDHYDQMFRLKFALIVEHPDQILEVEYRGKLTSAQKRFVDEMRSKGWSPRFNER
jgi:hypothetical protein